MSSTWCASVWGVEPPRSTVVICAATSDEQALVERVRGQVNDLMFELEVVEHQPAAIPETARALVWFTRPEPSVDRIVVHALEVDPRRSMAREIGTGRQTANGALTSGTLEAAALVVREALRVMQSGESALPESPTETAQTLPVVPPQSATVARGASERGPGLPTPSRGARAVKRSSLRGEVAWETTMDGTGPLRRQGPSFLLGAHYRGFELSAFAGLSLPVTEATTYGDLLMRRQSVGMLGGHEWSLSNDVSLGVGLRVGLVRYARSATALGPEVESTSDRVILAGLIGPQLRLGWALGSGPLELTLTTRLDAVPGAPTFGYLVEGRFEPGLAIWRLQPTIGLGVAFRTDRLLTRSTDPRTQLE